VHNDADLQIPRYPVRLVAQRTGVTPHVLRAWEKRYAVVTPIRTPGGQRLYSDLDIERLSRLRRLTDRGHAISRIAALPLDELTKLEQDAREARLPARGNGAAPATERTPPASAREFTEDVLKAARRLDAVELQGILERAAVTLGVPDFLDDVVAPALESIGHGWSAGSVSVAQEHMATVVFRRVLGWLIRLYEADDGAPLLVVATPPRQAHELGALMVAASAAAEGWGVTYLGPDLPVADLLSAVTETGARAVALSIVYAADGPELSAVLRETCDGLPKGVPLLVGGAATLEIRPHAQAAGALVMESLPELRAALQRLADEEEG
jgi:DNA-binding transcriptional MerR regulator/methylmalonyl-CoA mutase cobalamin-binding subunit